MKIIDLLKSKKTERTKPDLNLRGTDQLTVKEVFDNFAPAQKDGTACDLVSFGPNEFFLVIQGDQANFLTSLLMQALDQLQAKADDSDD